MIGLIGKNLHYSLSKVLHETLRPIDYQLIESDDLATTMASLKYTGLNITNPYKKAILAFADVLDESVKSTGVSNTLVKRSGLNFAYNTDYHAVQKIIADYIPKSSVCALLGNGATSDSYRVALIEHNCNVLVFARHPKENQMPLSELMHYQTIEYLINTTPVGTYPNFDDSLDVPFESLKNLKMVMDVVYNPYKTSLIVAAEKHNIKTLNGMLMLIYQALQSNALFYNAQYDERSALSLFKAALKKQLNLVLIGLPFSGKTHYGRLMGNRLNKKFIDLDKVFESHYKTTISEYFAKVGETDFRAAEATLATEMAQTMSVVISPGGGIVLNDMVMRRFKQNSVVIYIDLDEDLYPSIHYHSRPLVKTPEDLKKLKEARHQRYLYYADIVIKKHTYEEQKLIEELEVKLDDYFNHQWALLKSLRRT